EPVGVALFVGGLCAGTWRVAWLETTGGGRTAGAVRSSRFSRNRSIKRRLRFWIVFPVGRAKDRNQRPQLIHAMGDCSVTGDREDKETIELLELFRSSTARRQWISGAVGAMENETPPSQMAGPHLLPETAVLRSTVRVIP